MLVSAGTALADGASYTYDPNGRLVRVTYDNGTSVVYVYDSTGTARTSLRYFSLFSTTNRIPTS